MKNYKYILTHSSGNLTVEYNPINWKTLNIIFKRSDDYHSVLRSQAIDVEFPFDGKAYLDSIYTSYGIDTDIGCEIQYLDKSTKTYTTLYEGIIDLSEWVSSRDTTTVSIIDSSVMAKFVARDEIEVQLSRTTDIDGNTLSSYDYLNIMAVSGVDIYEQIYMSFITSQAAAPNTIEDTIETLTIEETEWDEAARYYENDSIVDVDTEYIAEVEIFYNLTFPTGGGVSNIYVYIEENGTTQEIAHKVVTTTSAETLSGSHSDSRTASFTVPAGGYLGAMYIQIASTPATITGYAVVVTGSLEMYEITPAKSTTFIDSPLLHEVGAKLLEIITGISDPLNSSLLGRTDSEPRTYGSDGDYSLTCLASGDMLREYAFSDKPLTTSFADFFKSIDALFNLGCWYNGSEFAVSEKADYYGTNKIITLGEVQDLEKSISQDDYFNQIECGYTDELSYDETNGTQNFNVYAEFVNEGTRIDNTTNIRSVYHADDYGIELSRKQGSYMHYSEDTDYDDQIFFIWGKRGTGNFESVPGSDLNAVDGIYAPDTRLNLHITPKRNLLRHSNHLAIPLFISNGETIYTSKQFELDLSTQLTSSDPVISEVDDLSYSDLEEPLYYPELYTFNAPLTNEHILQLQSDPHGYVEFDYIGVTYQGYILEVSTEPFMRQGNWTLIKCNPNRL